MQKPELKAVTGVNRNAVYRALGLLSLAMGVFLSGPVLVGQEMVSWVLHITPERFSLLILACVAVILIRGIAALLVTSLGLLVSGAACEQYFALDAAATMGGIGILLLMVGIGVLIFNPAH